jgi:pyruvate kinase
MRKTKIIATLGPVTDSPDMIGCMIDAGMNIARLTMSHATHDWLRRVVADIQMRVVA